MNYFTIKELVNTFSSIVASRSLDVFEMQLLENLSYISVVHNLIGDLNIHNSVYCRKSPLSIKPVCLDSLFDIDSRGEGTVYLSLLGRLLESSNEAYTNCVRRSLLLAHQLLFPLRVQKTRGL